MIFYFNKNDDKKNSLKKKITSTFYLCVKRIFNKKSQDRMIISDKAVKQNDLAILILLYFFQISLQRYITHAFHL